MRHLIHSAAWIALLIATPLTAQVRDTTKVDTTVFRIGEIRVEFARPVLTIGGASALEVSLDSLALPAAPSLEQVLRTLPTLHVRTNSRGEAEISVRGSESRQVAVLVDGVPLTLGWDARTDVSVVPATAPEQISLIRGLSSVLYGPNVLGGIVEMNVGRGTSFPARMRISGTVGFDHVGGYGVSATTSVPLTSSSGQWLIRAGAGYRDSPGATLPDEIAEPLPGSDPDLRLNTDASNIDGFLALRYRADGGTWLSFSSSGFRAERGIAAELGSQNPRLWRYPHISRLLAVASGGTGDRETPLGRGDLEASIGVDVGRSEIDAYATRAYDQVVGYENGDDRTVTLRLLGDHTLGERADLRSAFTYADIHHTSDLDGASADYRQRLWSLGGETVLRLLEAGSGALNSVRLSVGAAWDGGDTPESGGLPSLPRLHEWGARAGVTAAFLGGDVLVHAGASRRARFPALREVYSEALDRFEPNPGLQPEELVALEGGLTTRVGNGELQAVVFHHNLRDAIRRITLPSGRRQRVNADRIRSSGLELLLSQTVGRVALGGDMTLQAVELIDPNTSASSEPENLPQIFGSLHGSVRLPLALTATAEARYTGTQFCQDPDTGEDRELDAGTWLNGALSRVFTPAAMRSRIEARVSVDNIADTAIYDQCGLPQPGRLVRFQVRVF